MNLQLVPAGCTAARMHRCSCSCARCLPQTPAGIWGSLTWIAAVRARIVARRRQHVLQEPLVSLRFQRHGESIRPASPRCGGACTRTSAAGHRGGPVTCQPRCECEEEEEERQTAETQARRDGGWREPLPSVSLSPFITGCYYPALLTA